MSNNLNTCNIEHLHMVTSGHIFCYHFFDEVVTVFEKQYLTVHAFLKLKVNKCLKRFYVDQFCLECSACNNCYTKKLVFAESHTPFTVYVCFLELDEIQFRQVVYNGI